jgi:hypothetical protein
MTYASCRGISPSQRTGNARTVSSLGRHLLAGILTALIVSSAISIILLYYWPWTVFSKLQPANVPTSLGLLWQVDAALVTIALPLFLVIVQFSDPLRGELSTLPVTEVLRTETLVRPTLALAGFGKGYV